MEHIVFDNIEYGVISCADAAYPTVVRLDNNDLICGYSIGGGPNISGGTHWSRSIDEGKTWKYEGVILPRQDIPQVAANSLRLNRTQDGRLIAYGQKKYINNGTKFGRCKNEAVFCVADKQCKKWSEAKIIPNKFGCPLEISNPIIELEDKRWLAPAALLSSPERLGEKVVVWESEDKGKSWNNYYTALVDPNDKNGFFEQKIIETTPGKLFAFAWTVEMGSYRNLKNSFSVSEDAGKTWNGPFYIDIFGQTMAPLWLGGNRFLLIYNYRNSPCGIKLALVDICGHKCTILKDEYIWQPGVRIGDEKTDVKTGIDALDDIAFGLPSLLQLGDNKFLAVFWALDEGQYKIMSILFELQFCQLRNK
jgi:hypothetical protein